MKRIIITVEDGIVTDVRADVNATAIVMDYDEEAEEKVCAKAIEVFANEFNPQYKLICTELKNNDYKDLMKREVYFFE